MRLKLVQFIFLTTFIVLSLGACGSDDGVTQAPQAVVVDPCGDGVCSDDESAESCPVDCQTKDVPDVTPTEAIEPKAYVTFVVKVSDFVHLVDSAETLVALIDLFHSNGLKAEFFLNGPMTHAYLDNHPTVIQRLNETGMMISYHVSPPHPLVPGFQAPLEISAINLKQEKIAAYENQRLDLQTGELIDGEPGGYQFLTQTFGAPPSAVSIPDDPNKGFALPNYANLGAKMVVLYSEPGADLAQPFVQEYGMWVRPVDLNISRWPVEGIDAAMAWWDMLSTEFQTSYLPAARLESVTEAWNADRLPFITVTIDEYNFYREGPPPWTMIYYRDPSLTQVNLPPYDPNAPDLSSPRSEENAQAVWEAYKAMVEWAATHMQVITSADIVRMAEVGG